MVNARRATTVFALAVLALFLLGALPFGSPANTVAATSAPVGPHAAASGAAARAALPADTAPLGVHSSVATIVCPPTPPPSPVYSLVNGLYPPTPFMPLQGPCDLVDEDEVHATLTTTQAYSGEEYTQPIWLPPDTANASQASAYHQVIVGMIVAGNEDSEWRQSYAEVAFTPSGGSWSESLAIWSLVNSSYYGGNYTNQPPAKCPTNSMWFSWNASYFCEVDEASKATFGTSIPGGSWLNVTFYGVKGSTTRPLDLWVNDSTTSADDQSFVFSKTNTLTANYTPFYNSSCIDVCMLNWGYHFGLGVGIFPASYDEPLLRSLPPLTFGVPHFGIMGAYTGDYQYFSPESASGACYTGGSSTTIANCPGFLQSPNTGYYPFFTFNGTELNFGADWPWTTIEWGGANLQFFTSGDQDDLIPLSFYRDSNSSRAGFSPPAVPIWVNATVQDLGEVSGVNVTYWLNGGNPTNLAMTSTGGPLTNESFSATLPPSLGNGILNYTIVASNHAGKTELSPPFGNHTIRRGPLPHFNVTVTTNLLSCGKVTINGTAYPNGTVVSILPGTYSLYANGCYPWNFTTWSHTGGVAVPGGLTTRGSEVEIYANGTLGAHWTYIRPFDNISVAIAPTICGGGSVTIGNQTILGGSYGLFLDGANYDLSDSGCAGYLFSGWTFTGNFTVLTPVFTPHGNGTLTANYVSQSIAVALVFYTAPAGCGGVLYRGAGYPDGAQLSVAPGNYPVSGDPCAHYGFLKFETSGAASLTNANTTLNITNSATITEVNYHLTEVTVVVNPYNCGSVNVDGLDYGNGAVISVVNNSTHVAYPVASPGCYLIDFTADGGLKLVGNELTANGSGNITATFQRTPPSDTIAFLTNPSNCGTINFDGQPYLNSNFTTIAAGLSYTISALPCPGYGFVNWLTYGEISISGSAAYVNSSGAIEAVFQPLVTLFVFTAPTDCGQVVIDGHNFTDNSTIALASLDTYTIGAVPCVGDVFVGWQNTSGAEITGDSMYLAGSAFLTAVFTPQVYLVTVTIDPASCGTVRLNGQTMLNGSALRLTAGLYALVPLPCIGDHLDHWATNGSVNVSGSDLVVAGAGNLTAFYAPVVPTLFLSIPSNSLAGDAVQLTATVPVPIPPFTYNFTWTFGDGTSQLTSANTTLHTYAAAGTYTVHVQVRDPDNRTANASGTITVDNAAAAEAVTFTTGELVGFGLIGAALVAVLGLIVLRRRGDGGGTSPDGTELATAGPTTPAVSATEQKP